MSPKSLLPWTLLSTAALLLPRTAAQFNSAISPCPIRCGDVKYDTSEWTYYHDFGELDVCDGTVLFQTNIYNPIRDASTHIYFRACTASGGTVIASTPRIGTSGTADHLHSPYARRQALSINGSTPSSDLLKWTTWNSEGGLGNVTSAQSITSELQSYVQSVSPNTTTMFARAGNAVGGLYIGSQVDLSSAFDVLKAFNNRIGQETSFRVAAQACGSSNETISPQYFGIILDGTGDTATIQSALKSWDQATCVEGDKTSPWEGQTLDFISGKEVPIEPNHGAKERRDFRAVLHARDTCRYTQVQSGDGCYALAQRCGISQGELESYNGEGDFCSTLKPDQYVCCSPGSLPDFTPKPNDDGSCFAYTVVENDNCADIAQAHQMTVQDIESRNDQTWGWQGCKNIFIGMNMCLSSGRPPFPSSVDNAVCGPQVKGTEMTSDPSGWADLNPCPLNACCDIFGQCGVTKEFCTANPADTGNPGTAQPGSNGCISNCGTDIITGPQVSNFEHVGYYEAFGADRPCLHLSVNDIPDKYTIVHWAFADVTPDFQPNIDQYLDAWNSFKKQTGFKRIVSFGGWAFSTAPNTYPILREAVKPANRQTFANNVASFVQDNDLDGVDFDWEYPGAPDDQGEGIPVDSPESAMYYLEFLQLLRSQLPDRYSMAVAIPASYYYLKAFPIHQMSEVLNYFIYMTYDLHGQWDFGNKFTMEGCPAGDCLRSHVNRTETETAFSMITKAGVPANKVMMGAPLYGRSFKMSQAGCYGQDCTFTGPKSGAKTGRCTGTAGYISNYEINEIIGTGKRSIEQHSSEEAGDIMVYDDTEWVSYMKPETYAKRIAWAASLGLAGASDWAMDLDLDATDGGDDSGGDSSDNSDNANADQLCNEVRDGNLKTADWQESNFSCAPISYREPGSGDIIQNYDSVLTGSQDNERSIQALWRKWSPAIGEKFSCKVSPTSDLVQASVGTRCDVSLFDDEDNVDCSGDSLNDTAPVCLRAMYNWLDYFTDFTAVMRTEFDDLASSDFFQRIDDRYGRTEVPRCGNADDGSHDPFPTSLSSALTVLGGFFGFASAFKSLSAVGAAGSGITGIVSGGASAVSGLLMDTQKFKIDNMEFKNLTELQGNISDIVIDHLVKGTQQFMTDAVNAPPAVGDQTPRQWAENDHMGLPWILSDGVFAESQVPPEAGGDTTRAIREFITSTAIGWAIRSQKTFLMFGVEGDLGFDPCIDTNSSFNQRQYADDQFISCSGGGIFEIFQQQEGFDDAGCEPKLPGKQWVTSFQEDFPNVSLADLYLANATQEVVMGPRYNGNAAEYLMKTFNPNADLTLEFLNFQLPVCSLSGDFPEWIGLEEGCKGLKNKYGDDTPCGPDQFYRYRYGILRATCLCSGANNPYPSWESGKKTCRRLFDDAKGVTVAADAQLPPGSQ